MDTEALALERFQGVDNAISVNSKYTVNFGISAILHDTLKTLYSLWAAVRPGPFGQMLPGDHKLQSGTKGLKNLVLIEQNLY